MRTAFITLIVLGTLTGQAMAQSIPLDGLVPQLPTAAERRVADVASWGTVLAALTLDTRASWQSADRSRAFELQAVRLGVTFGAVSLLKVIVQRERPCAADGCGLDNPRASFPSGHTAFAFSTFGGPSASVSLPLSITSGGLRIAAGKHWFTDTLAGAAIGLATSRIR